MEEVMVMPLATMRGLNERQSSEPMLARIEEEEQESDYLSFPWQAAVLLRPWQPFRTVHRAYYRPTDIVDVGVEALGTERFPLAAEYVMILAAKYIQMEQALSRAFQRLDYLLTKEENWYFHGARPISPDAVKRAKEILSSLRSLPYLSEKVEPFAIVPSVTGAVQLEWRGDHGSLEVEIGSQGPLGYFLEDRQGGEEESETASDQEIPELLRRIL